jgi:hypothetical protein
VVSRILARRRLVGLAASTVVLLGVATACTPGSASVTTDPALYPTFQANVIDYVNRCDPSTPTDIDVTAPSGTTVSVDGQPARTGSFTTQVSQDVGERFTIRVSNDAGTRTHHVRCLPLDFPQWSAERTGTPQAQYYATVLPLSFLSGAPRYGALFDTNGVPVWWTRDRLQTLLLTLLPNRHLAVVTAGGAQEIALDGSLVRTIANVGGPTDTHDVILLPNGNYMLATAQRQQADLSVWGTPYEADTTVINHVFQEITPAGAVVWSWDTAEHIPVTETTPTWRSEPEPVTGLADPWHYNSVEWTGDGLLISFRHLDAVYKVDKATGDIAWKLGGTTRPESLTVVDDPVFTGGGSFSGQHDARLLPDGTVTLFDNGSRKGRAPRSVRYDLDLGLRTATLLEEVTDAVAPSSFCCGSARRLPGGNWVTGWGGTAHVTEQEPDGTRVFQLDGAPSTIYRGTPIPFGRLSPSALRAGMEAQYAG